MQAWSSRLLRDGPRLVSLLLGALIVEECARAIVPLWPRPASVPQRVPAARGIRTHRALSVDVRPIVAAHLFGTAVEDSPDSAESSPTRANLVLVGVLAKENPKRGIAIITADGPAQVYSVGDDVDGASLHSVYLDRVVLDRSGRLETLTLPRSQSNEGNALHLPPQAVGNRVARNAQSPQSRPVPLHRLSDIIQVEAAVDDQSDSLLGFRIQPGAGTPAFMRAGLRLGDLMTAVNGTQLVNQDRQHSQEVVDTMLASDRANVSIVRNGKSLDLSLDLSQ